MKENRSGTIRIHENRILWEFRDKILEEVNADEIAVIGEFTNTNGPKYDDWFMVFVTKDGNWKNFSLYADNVDQLTQFITHKFGHNLNDALLANSVAWASVVVHPQHLIGKDLFKFEVQDSKKSKSILDRILNPLGRTKFRQQHLVDLSDEVKKEVENSLK